MLNAIKMKAKEGVLAKSKFCRKRLKQNDLLVYPCTVIKVN